MMSVKVLEQASRKEGEQSAYPIDFIPRTSNSMLQKSISMSAVIRINTSFHLLNLYSPFYLTKEGNTNLCDSALRDPAVKG